MEIEFEINVIEKFYFSREIVSKKLTHAKKSKWNKWNFSI